MAVRSRTAFFLLIIAAAMLSSSCYVNQNALWSSDKLSPDAPVSHVPSISNVSYGPEPANHLDVLLPDVPQIGVILYFHSGGWCCGEQNQIDRMILSEIDRGYAVVSADIRGSLVGTAAQILADADRALRFTKANRTRWGAGRGKVLVAGGSAGGNIALLVGSAPGVFAGPNLPAELAAVDPHVDGVISLVGPSDLRPYLTGEIPVAGLDGQALVEDFLDCSDRGRIVPANPPLPAQMLPACDPSTVLKYSPLFWAVVTAYFGGQLPPVYLAYGRLDVLVPPDGQAEPLAFWWQMSAGFLATYLDIPPTGGHNLTFDINKSAFDVWLGFFAAP
jgi:acetyl esterase/lipase